MFKKSTHEPIAFKKHKNTIKLFNNPNALSIIGNIIDNKKMA